MNPRAKASRTCEDSVPTFQPESHLLTDVIGKRSSPPGRGYRIESGRLSSGNPQKGEVGSNFVEPLSLSTVSLAGPSRTG